MKKLTYFLVLLFCFSLSSQLQAEEMKDLEKMSEQIKSISKKLNRGKFEGEDLTAWTKLTIKLKSASSLCVSNSEIALLDMKTKMDGLGEKVKGEDKEVTKQRSDYQKQKDELDKKLAKCNLYVASGDEVSALISEAEKSYFKQKYLAKSPHMIDLAMTYLKNPVSLLKDSGEFIIKRSGINEIDTADIAASIIVVILSIFLGIFIRKKLLSIESRRQWQDDFSENFVRAILTTFSCSMPYIMGSAVAALSSVVITLEVEEIPFVTELFVGLLVFFCSTTIIRLLLDPYPPAKLFLTFTPSIAKSLAKRFKVLAVLGLVGYMAFYTSFSESIVESNLFLLRNIFSLFFVINMVWMLQVILKSPKLPKLRYISMLVIIVMVVSLIAEWMGYRNIAFASRRVIMMTFVTLVIFIGIAKIFRDLFDAVDDGTYAWCRRIHKTLGLEKGEKVPGLI